MYTNTGMYAGYEVEANKEIYKESKSTTTNTSYSTGAATSAMPGMVMAPIYECPQERVIHREIMHEVPQDYPFMLYL